MPLSTNAHIQAATASRQVPPGPELITRTLLVQRLQQLEPKITCWKLRKAEQQAFIRPDKTGRFAGHAVHYYDAARIPELMRHLLAFDRREAGSLIIHSQLGAGRILAADATDPSRRVVLFFANSARVSVRSADIRRLLSTSSVAQQLGVNRKLFAKLASLYGINPDYGETRKFYDEARVQEIREIWSLARSSRSVHEVRSF